MSVWDFLGNLVDRGWNMWSLIITLPAAAIVTAVIVLWRWLWGYPLTFLTVVITGIGVTGTFCLFFWLWNTCKSKNMLRKFFEFIGGHYPEFGGVKFRLQASYHKEKGIVYQLDSRPICPKCNALLKHIITGGEGILKCLDCSFEKKLDCSGYDFSQTAQNSIQLQIEKWEQENA